MSSVYIILLFPAMFKILGNTHLESVLLVAFVKYIFWQLYSCCIQNCIFGTFWRLWKVFFDKRNSKFSDDFVLFYLRNSGTSNLHNLGVVGRRKLPEHLLNNIFKNLLIGLQYIFSFTWPDFSLKGLVKTKGQSPKFKRCCITFPVLK